MGKKYFSKISLHANYTRQQQTHLQSSQIAILSRKLSNSFVSLPLLSHLIHFECVFIYIRFTLILFEVKMQTIFSLRVYFCFLFVANISWGLLFTKRKNFLCLAKNGEDKNARKERKNVKNSWQHSLGNCCKWNKNNYFSVDVDYYHALAWEWTFRRILYAWHKKIKHVLRLLVVLILFCDSHNYESCIVHQSVSRGIPKPISKEIHIECNYHIVDFFSSSFPALQSSRPLTTFSKWWMCN